MKTVKIKVSGMSCGHCASTVKNLLIDERGVESVDVNLENKNVSISGNDKMSLQALIDSVNMSGKYQAEKIA